MSIGEHLYPVPDNFKKWTSIDLCCFCLHEGQVYFLLRNHYCFIQRVTKGVESYFDLALKAQIRVADHFYRPAPRQRMKTFLPGNKLHEPNRCIADENSPRERITLPALKAERALSYENRHPARTSNLAAVAILKIQTPFHGDEVTEGNGSTLHLNLEDISLFFRIVKRNLLPTQNEDLFHRALGVVDSQYDHSSSTKGGHFRPQRASNRPSHPGALHDKHPFASGQCAISAIYVNRCLHIQHCDSSDFIDDIDIEISTETCLSETIEDHLSIENTEAHIWARGEHNLFGSRAEV